MEGSDEGLFWNIFQNWREQVPLTDVEKDEILKKLEKWIRIRVEGIMNGNHRKYYGECASYIAALGEVRESRGEKMAKERLMQSYRETYSRRRAFHDELRAYGMKDTRKKR